MSVRSAFVRSSEPSPRPSVCSADSNNQHTAGGGKGCTHANACEAFLKHNTGRRKIRTWVWFLLLPHFLSFAALPATYPLGMPSPQSAAARYNPYRFSTIVPQNLQRQQQQQHPTPQQQTTTNAGGTPVHGYTSSSLPPDTPSPQSASTHPKS